MVVVGEPTNDLDGTDAGRVKLLAKSEYYTVEVTPDAEGTVEVLVAAGAATDILGHASFVSNQLDFIYDIGPPGVTLTTTSTESPAGTTTTTAAISTTFAATGTSAISSS
jgi:hypothetical protein